MLVLLAGFRDFVEGLAVHIRTELQSSLQHLELPHDTDKSNRRVGGLTFDDSRYPWRTSASERASVTPSATMKYVAPSFWS